MKIARYELEWYRSASVSIVPWLLAELSEDPAKYRLPTNITPNTYTISVKPYLEIGNFTFDGHVKIEAEVERGTSEIVLHSAAIDHHTVTVTANKTNVNVTNVRSEEKYDFCIIELAEKLEPKTKLIIEIAYTGHLNATELRGFYKSSYVDEAGRTR